MPKLLINPLLKKQMSRKEFLIFWGTTIITMMGIIAVLKKLEDSFAASPYVQTQAASGTLTTGATAVSDGSGGNAVQFGPPTVSTGNTAGFGQPIMAPPNGPGLSGNYTTEDMIWQDTFQTGSLNQSYWRNTMGTVTTMSNNPGFVTGSATVQPASSGGGLILDNTTGGASSCVVTCEPAGAGATNLVVFPQGGWYIQVNAKMSDMSDGFFPCIWLPTEGIGLEIDVFQGGWIEEQGETAANNNKLSHSAYNPLNPQAINYQALSYQIGIDLNESFVIYGIEYRPQTDVGGAGGYVRSWLNNVIGLDADNPPWPTPPTYSLAITPQLTPANSTAWHTQGTGAGQMYIAEVQLYQLP